MENPMVNYAKIIKETNSQMFNVRDEFKDNTVEQNQRICKNDRLPFSVGMINVTGDLNIGMAIRSACLMGAENFYIFGRRKFDSRSTVGAENYINIIQYTFDDPLHADEEILHALRELGKTHRIILCEHGGSMLGDRTSSFYDRTETKPIFIFGSESHGIPSLITEQTIDCGEYGSIYEFERVSIPQRGVLRSFNVSAACNIILWDYCKEMFL